MKKYLVTLPPEHIGIQWQGAPWGVPVKPLPKTVEIEADAIGVTGGCLFLRGGLHLAPVAIFQAGFWASVQQV